MFLPRPCTRVGGSAHRGYCRRWLIGLFCGSGNFAGGGLGYLFHNLGPRWRQILKIATKEVKLLYQDSRTEMAIRSVLRWEDLLEVLNDPSAASWHLFEFSGTSAHAGTDVVHPAEQFVFLHAIQDAIFRDTGNKSRGRRQFHKTKLTRAV